MAALKIAPKDLVLPDHLFELITGKGKTNIYLGNNLMNSALNIPSSKQSKPLYTMKTGITDKYGTCISMTSPNLYFKTYDGSYTSSFRIELTSALRVKETYYFNTPPDSCYAQSDEKLKNDIISSIENASITEKLIRLDNIVCLALEFLILATAVQFDFTKYENDIEMIKELFKKIAPTNSERLFDSLNVKYFDYISNPIVWQRSEENPGNFEIYTEDNDDEESKKYFSLFSVIYNNCAKKANSKDALGKEILSNVFGNKTDSKFFKFIMNCKDNNVIPKARFMRIAKKGSEEEVYDIRQDLRLMFYVKTSNMKENFPSFLLASEVKPKGIIQQIDQERFKYLIGRRGEQQKSSRVKYTGYIWVSYSIDLTKFAKYQPHTSWIVHEFALNEVSMSAPTISFDGYDLEETTTPISENNENKQDDIKNTEDFLKDAEEIEE